MDTVCSPYGSDNTTAGGVIGTGKLMNDSMMYSANTSSRTLRDAKGVRVEANLQLL